MNTKGVFFAVAVVTACTLASGLLTAASAAPKPRMTEPIQLAGDTGGGWDVCDDYGNCYWQSPYG